MLNDLINSKLQNLSLMIKESINPKLKIPQVIILCKDSTETMMIKGKLMKSNYLAGLSHWLFLASCMDKGIEKAQIVFFRMNIKIKSKKFTTCLRLNWPLLIQDVTTQYLNYLF